MVIIQNCLIIYLHSKKFDIDNLCDPQIFFKKNLPSSYLKKRDNRPTLVYTHWIPPWFKDFEILKSMNRKFWFFNYIIISFSEVQFEKNNALFQTFSPIYHLLYKQYILKNVSELDELAPSAWLHCPLQHYCKNLISDIEQSYWSRVR